VPDTKVNGTWAKKIPLPSAPGTATLQLVQAMVAATGTTYYYSCNDIQITLPTALQIAAVLPEPGIRLRANPAASGQPVVVEIRTPASASLVTVFNVRGERMGPAALSLAAGANHTVMLPALPSGVYLIRLQAGQRYWIRRLLVL
jgi:hypothetical protein